VAATSSLGLSAREPSDHLIDDDDEDDDDDDEFGRLLGHLREFSELAALASGEMPQNSSG
jgi:hypothetical protein